MPIKVISDDPDSDEEHEYDMNYLDKCEMYHTLPKIGPSFNIRRGKCKFPTPISFKNILKLKISYINFVLSHKPSWAGCFAGDIKILICDAILSLV